jgi:uncharacterized membrane protein YeaQ/YmgE (transglycosylase-associated protein family)
MADRHKFSEAVNEGCMTISVLIAALITSLAAGWLAGLVTRGDGFGIAGNVLVALLGALPAAYLAGAAGLPYADTAIGAAIVALLSAFLLLAAIAEMRR